MSEPILSKSAPSKPSLILDATPAARDLVRKLMREHGPLMFHQSGGCCDGSVPLCFKRGEFQVGSRDVLIGTVEGNPFYVGHAQYDYLIGTRITLDVIPGDLDSFSLEAGSGVRFISRSNTCLVPDQQKNTGELPDSGTSESHKAGQ